MSEILGNLKPQAVFHYFEQIIYIRRVLVIDGDISFFLVMFS